ncbi:MAG: peptidoglycan-binding protein LysM [Pseudomonadota bacterium]|jgi:nucleoid-associated protein YgaU
MSTTSFPSACAPHHRARSIARQKDRLAQAGKISMPAMITVYAAGVVAVAYFALGRSGQDATHLTAAAPAAATAPQTSNTQALESAVSDALASAAATPAKDQAFIDAQRAQAAAKSAKPADGKDDLTAKLDALAKDKQALAAHNQDVFNKVQLAQAGGAHGPADDARASLEAAVAGREADGGKNAAFVGAISGEASARASEMRTVVVVAGDTLSIIAHRIYGDPQAYRRIFDANPRVLTSPNHIYPGQVLRVPSV